MESDESSYPHSTLLKRFLMHSSKPGILIDTRNENDNSPIHYMSKNIADPNYSKSQFSCDYCDSTFISVDLLSIHIELEHKCMEIETIQFEKKEELVPPMIYGAAAFSSKEPSKDLYMECSPNNTVLPQQSYLVNTHGSSFIPSTNINGYINRPPKPTLTVTSPDTIYYQPSVNSNIVRPSVTQIKQEFPVKTKELPRKYPFTYPVNPISKANSLSSATTIKHIRALQAARNPPPVKKTLYSGENLNGYLKRWFLKKKLKIERSLKLPTEETKEIRSSPSVSTKTETKEDSANLPVDVKNNEDSANLPVDAENSEDSSKLPVDAENNEDLSKLPADAENNEDSPNLPVDAENNTSAMICQTEARSDECSSKCPDETENNESLPSNAENCKELNSKVESDSEESWQNKRYSSRATRPVFLYQSEEISQLFNFKNNLTIKRKNIQIRQSLLKKYPFLKNCSVVLDKLEDCIAKHDDVITSFANKKLQLGEKNRIGLYKDFVKNVAMHFVSDHKVRIKKPKPLFCPKLKKPADENNTTVSILDYGSDYSGYSEFQNVETPYKEYLPVIQQKCSMGDVNNSGNQEVQVSKPPTAVCKICLRVFNKEYLKRHLKRIHGEQNESSSSNTASSLSYDSDYSSYSESQQSDPPQKEYHSLDIKPQIAGFSNVEHQEVKISRPPTAVCKVCSKVFNKKYLSKHLKDIHGIGNFKCEFCNIVSRSREEFREHQKLHCNNVMSNPSNLTTVTEGQQDLVSMENMVYDVGLLPNITPEQKRNMIRNNPLLYNLLISEPKSNDFAQFGWTVIGNKQPQQQPPRQQEAPVNNRVKAKCYPLPNASRNLSYLTDNTKLY